MYASTFQSIAGFWSWRETCSLRRTGRKLEAVLSTKPDGIRKPMMKIQMKEFEDNLVLQVEGRLAGAFVHALEHSWREARASQPNRRISVDLKSVTCIDRTGRNLLQAMHSDGVGFLRAGLAIQDILEQVMEAPECKH